MSSLSGFAGEDLLTQRPAKRQRTIKSEYGALPPWSNSSLPTPSPSRAVVPVDEAEAGIELNKEQQDLVKLIVSGKNVFYTGSAGCGKSTVLKAFVARLRTMGKRVSITAPTGRAALDVNGSTTWTFAGWVPDSMKKSIDQLEKDVYKRHTRKRLQEIDVLVIDEISMVENHFFERLNRIMKVARNSREAFGGVQTVVAGDFCQLPPIKPFGCCMECGKEMRTRTPSTVYYCPAHGDQLDVDKWAFCSRAWVEAKFTNIYLRQVYRQTDPTFIAMLEKIRLGKTLTEDEQDTIEDHPCNVTDAVRLCSTKNQVRAINSQAFNKLPGRKYTYTCLDHFKWNKEHEHLKYKDRRSQDGSLMALQDHSYENSLELKQGMRVVLLQNIDVQKGLVNGSQGYIVGFQAHADNEAPRARSKYESSAFGTDDRRERLASDDAPSLGGDHVYLRQEQIKQFAADHRNQDKYWPIVRFDNGRNSAIYANCSVSSMGDDEPYSLISRTQIPLTAAWAMTIHKSQGMTLDRVIVDVSNIFEEGQLYVALSRAKSLFGLKLEGYSSGYEVGRANQEVKDFLYRVFGIQ